jgi:protein-tyrosine kinase
MLSDLFKKKDKQSSRVAAIVKYYDDMQLPLPPEVVEAAKKEGWVVPEAKQAPPAPEPARAPEKEGWAPPADTPSRQFAADPKQPPPSPEPARAPEKERWVSPSDTPSRRLAAGAKQAPPAPEPARAPEKEGWTPPADTPSRRFAADAKQAPPAPEPARTPEKEGWVSPSYTQSRQVVLNPKQLLANRCVGYKCGSYESESYKVLRTRLLHKTGEKGGTTIMITSALPGEGKTLTAINLSLTFAKEYNQTVLLVDSDLHKQNVHERLGFESDRGLADYLLNGTSLADLIVWPGVEKFTLISGGRTVMASSELLGSPRMKGLVKDLKSRYPDRYVFFDVPPVLAGADALAFAPQMDYIILVVRAGSTSIEDVKLALDLLPRKKVLGVVLNRADEADSVSRYHTYKKYREDTGADKAFARRLLGSGRVKK